MRAIRWLSKPVFSVVDCVFIAVIAVATITVQHYTGLPYATSVVIVSAGLFPAWRAHELWSRRYWTNHHA